LHDLDDAFLKIKVPPFQSEHLGDARAGGDGGFDNE